MFSRYCLFVEKVASYSRSKAKTSLPYVPLLRACKAVYYEAESVVYENTFILSRGRAIQKLFDRTLPTPARKLLLKSVEVSLQIEDPMPEYKLVLYDWDQMRLSQRVNTQGADNSCVRNHYIAKALQRDIIWRPKVIPILDNLMLDRLVLDLSQSFWLIGCNCMIAAMAITCFKKGFALWTPKFVEIKGWDAGREDIEAVVQDCLGIWTSRRARLMEGFSHSPICIKSEAEEWLLKEATREEKPEQQCW